MTGTAGRWAAIHGYQGSYQVHTGSGQVRSLDRWVTNALGRRRFYPGKTLALVVPRQHQGSPRFNLSAGGRSRAFRPAQLIALAVADG